MRRTARPLRAVAFALARTRVPRMSRPRRAAVCFIGSVTVHVTVERPRAVLTLQVARAAAACDCCEPPPTPRPGRGVVAPPPAAGRPGAAGPAAPPPPAGALGAAGAAGVLPPHCGGPSDVVGASGPLPASVAIVVPTAVLSATVSVAARAPLALGVKRTSIVQVSPGATVASAQVLETTS